jgi:hypothetical protein
MDYQVNRFVIEVSEKDEKTSVDQLDMDFFLQPEHRKVILGTVRLPDGNAAPCAVVKFFKLKDSTSDAEITEEIEPIGHAIADEGGQFLLGPVYPGEKYILKIFYSSALMSKAEVEPSRSTRKPE